MNESTPKQQDKIIVNARFLTHRITGLERYAVEISRQLKKIRPSLTFVAPKDIMHQSLAEELGVECFGMLTGHLWEQIEFPLFLRRKNNPLLINLVNTGPMWYRNQITVIHDLAFLRNPEWFSRSAAMWFKFLVLRVINTSSVVIAQSAFTKSEIIGLLEVPEKKIRIVYPGISEIFISRRKPGEKKGTGKTILAVSTLELRKNLKHLIEGFKIAGLKDAELVVVGGDNSLVFGKSGLKKKYMSDPTVKFLGYVSDAQLTDLYHQADIFASVSLYEGFGFPPLEALASGCRVLVSDIPTHRETLGDCAMFVNPLDSVDIAQKLILLLASSAVPQNTEIEKMLLKFSWRRAAEDLLRIAETTLHID
ncbi:MAG: glycosyltransferase family 1 protein [Bacteroidota bacterium]